MAYYCSDDLRGILGLEYHIQSRSYRDTITNRMYHEDILRGRDVQDIYLRLEQDRAEARKDAMLYGATVTSTTKISPPKKKYKMPYLMELQSEVDDWLKDAV